LLFLNKKIATPLKVIERYTDVFILIDHPSSDENTDENFPQSKKKFATPLKINRKIYERLCSECSPFIGWKH